MTAEASHVLGYEFSDLEDIPGTTIFTVASARRAYRLHRFCMSLMKPEGREAFKADERSCLEGFGMTPEQVDGVLARDFNRLIELGGNIYFLVKIASADGWSAQKAVSTMTSLSPDEYAAMMVAGGRSPKGNRSTKGGW